MADEDDGGDSKADQIRRYVLEKYISPARANGRSTVTITVGALNNEMGLNGLYSLTHTLRDMAVRCLAA